MERVLSEFILVSYFLRKVYEPQLRGRVSLCDITISGSFLQPNLVRTRH
jgi:hypothetical protein